MASAFVVHTGSNAASFRRCNASPAPYAITIDNELISAFENGSSTQPIFVYHPQRKMREVICLSSRWPAGAGRRQLRYEPAVTVVPDSLPCTSHAAFNPRIGRSASKAPTSVRSHQRGIPLQRKEGRPQRPGPMVASAVNFSFGLALRLAAHAPAPGTCLPGPEPGACFASCSLAPSLAPPTPRRIAPSFLSASRLLWRSQIFMRSSSASALRPSDADRKAILAPARDSGSRARSSAHAGLRPREICGTPQ